MIFFNQRRVEQFNGREAETATLLSRRLFTLSLRVAVSAHVISAVGLLLLKSNVTIIEL
jgi:hypothetical protein